MNNELLVSQIEYDCQLFILETTTSTNDELVRRACELTSLPLVPLVVISDTQTGGRGRLGRKWVSPAGGLYLSVLLDAGVAKEDSSRLASLSPLVALAAREALQVFTGSELLVKWPNDVLVATGKNAGKLVGILVEVKPASALLKGSADNAQFVVIGIGVNVNRPSVGAHETAAYLNDDSDQCLQLESVASAVINELLRQIAVWQTRGCLFSSFAESYVRHMAGIGETACVRNANGDEIAQGIVRGIDEFGSLLLQGATGEIAVTSGEVTLREPHQAKEAERFMPNARLCQVNCPK